MRAGILASARARRGCSRRPVITAAMTTRDSSVERRLLAMGDAEAIRNGRYGPVVVVRGTVVVVAGTVVVVVVDVVVVVVWSCPATNSSALLRELNSGSALDAGDRVVVELMRANTVGASSVGSNHRNPSGWPR